MDCPTIHFYKFLADHEAHSDSFTILLGSSPQFAKHGEHALNFCFSHSFTSVVNMNT